MNSRIDGRTPVSAAAKPFFRADHVGSLLRPPALLRARGQWKAGTIGREELRSVEDEAIAEVVRLQESVGLRAISDGEFRRENWWIDFIGQIGGIEISAPDTHAGFRKDGSTPSGYLPKQVRTVGEVCRPRDMMADDYLFLRSRTRLTPKITIPSPTRIHFHGGRASVDVNIYPDMAAFWRDVAALYRAEIASLERLGCSYIQLDDPVLTYFLDDRLRENVRAIGEDPDQLIHVYARAINDCIAGRRPSTCLAIHLCRGNARSAWIAQGSYDRLAEALFPTVGADVWFLEYDDERSGSFEPLRFMPTDRKVVLGLITSKRGTLEDRDEVRRRIDAAARFVALDNLGLSPQCGFASLDEGNLITSEEQERKLRLVVELASDVWGAA
jgi:5-methyltetrahydropteroyltriglutamate--homocysteine methyltransferase